MEKTVITIDMDKTSLREAMTRIIEYLSLTPPNPEELRNEELIEYNMGIDALFSCLRQTFWYPLSRARHGLAVVRLHRRDLS